MNEICTSLMQFLDNSPTMFHACENAARNLRHAGFIRLSESSVWELCPGGKYYVNRGDSSLIAFRLPQTRPLGFMAAAAHSDSPSFKIRQNAEVSSPGGVVRLSVEKYGGAILRSWLDRPLSLAGRVFYKEGERICRVLIDIDKDLLFIPSMAPHLRKEVNTGEELKANIDLLPLFAQTDEKDSFNELIAQTAKIPPQDMISGDLYLYPRERASLIGANDEFLLSPRIDDLECAWCVLQGLITSGESASVALYCLFNNEEVGSGTWQGADSKFLEDTIVRICSSLDMSDDERLAILASSFMVSADNAHAVHPGHAEYYDSNELPKLNGGVVIKYNAAQKYATDGLSAAVFTRVCELAGVPVQHYSNRADLPGGSTLGHISLAHVSVPTVDIGLAQLAMHSCCELTGAHDPERLQNAMKEYFSRSLLIKDDVYSMI